MFSFIFQHKTPNQNIFFFPVYYKILLNLYLLGSCQETEGTVTLVIEESVLFTKAWRSFRETAKG